MRTFIKIFFLLLILTSCEDMIYKEQPQVLTVDNNYKDWVDYRSAELGMYALQQELAEQLIILGELRGDLIKTSDDADEDLKEIENFNVSSTNKYASANNFYRLIASCNALIRTLEMNRPYVTDPSSDDDDYQRIYGEAICMRGWAYFNAARIYGEIPYVPEAMTDYTDVIEYVMNPDATFYVDSGRYVYDINGLDIIDVNDTVWYPVDTVYLDTIQFETYSRRFLDIYSIVDIVSEDINERARFVGVDYAHKDNIDDGAEWEAIIWSEYSKDYLLAQMALTVGDINAAYDYLNEILNNYENEDDIRFGLDEVLAEDNWKSIFQNINTNEHIYTMWFGKQQQQTHELQRLFDNESTNLYYLRPTNKAVLLWETEWVGQRPEPALLYSGGLNVLQSAGRPGDFYRGHDVSYIYKDGDRILDESEVRSMLRNKSEGDYVEVDNIMRGVDTLVYKYTRDEYANDAFVTLFRASSAHLYAAEIAAQSEYLTDQGGQASRLYLVSGYLAGTYNRNPAQLGVRGRVDLPGELNSEAIVYQDPFTNEVLGATPFPADGLAQRRYYEDVVLEERAKELAFEGERFYDLMRIAQRHNDPSILADMVANTPGKYSSELREEVHAKLMDPNNWYIPFFLIEN